MKIYLVVDDDNGWIASGHLNKDEADELVKGLRYRSVKEVEVHGEIEVFAMIHADSPYGHSVGEASVNAVDMDFDDDDYFVENFKVKI